MTSGRSIKLFSDVLYLVKDLDGFAGHRVDRVFRAAIA